MESDGGLAKPVLTPFALAGLVRLIFKIALLFVLVFVLVYQMHEYSQLVVPVRDLTEATETSYLAESLINLGAPKKKVGELSEAVRNASRATALPWQLLIALMYTESAFKEDAISSKNYKGLMQIPQEIPYPDANILIGARMLEDKIRIANGDLNVALAMYKGGIDKPQARRQAAYTLTVYKRLKNARGGGNESKR